ncbi:MAG: TIGR02186 family protein, partial [Planktomarina sp.]
MRYLLTIFLLLATPVLPQNIVLGLSTDEIGITAFFDGSEIFVFGAVKHEGAIDDEQPLEVAIAIASPRTPVTVRRKEQRLGIW